MQRNFGLTSFLLVRQIIGVLLVTSVLGCDIPLPNRSKSSTTSDSERLQEGDALTEIVFCGSDVTSRAISDKDWEEIASQNEPFKLVFQYANIRDDHFWRLEGCESLRALHIEGGKFITDQAIRHLLEIPHLESLFLEDCAITDQGLGQIASQSSLKKLTLRNMSKISSEGVAQLATLTTLEELHLEGFVGILASDVEKLMALTELRALTLSGGGIASGDLSMLTALSQLETLTLICNGVSDAGIDHLRALPKLRSLTLDSTQLTDVAISELRKLQPLEELGLRSCRLLTDRGMESFREIPSLHTLELNGLYGITNRGLSMLDHMTSLKEVRIIDCPQLTDTTLDTIVRWRDLQVLELSDLTRLTDSGLKPLATLSTLRQLRLPRCPQLTDHGMMYLRDLSDLVALDIAGADVTNQAASLFMEMPYLEEVNVQDTAISDQGVKYLSQLPRLARLNLSGCTAITDDGLLPLGSVQTLRLLDLPSSVSSDTLNTLQSRLPKCNVRITRSERQKNS